MNNKKLKAFAQEAAKSIKTEQDLSNFSQMLTKVIIEAALNIELDESKIRLGLWLMAHKKENSCHFSSLELSISTNDIFEGIE